MVTSRPPVSSGPPSISGNPQEGSTLTANPGTWTGTQPINFAYQWLRCDPAGANCSDIGGATNQTYDVAVADIALTIRVRVTATNIAGSPGLRRTAPQTAQVSGRLPVNTALPAISGNPEEGSTLSATGGTWTGTDPISLTYQWLRCDLAGKQLRRDRRRDRPGLPGGRRRRRQHPARARHRRERGGLNLRRLGSPRRRSAPARPPTTSCRRSPATPQEGSTLTADPGTWTGTEPIDFAYQWLRCDSAGRQLLRHRRRNEPDLRPRARRRRLDDPRPRHRDELSEHAGQRRQRSDRRGDRPPARERNAARDLRQPHVEGSTLTASPGTWTGTQPIDFAYQWLRCDAPGANCTDINGATSQTYDVVAADIGSTIRVNVTASNVAGSASTQSRRDSNRRRAAPR